MAQRYRLRSMQMQFNLQERRQMAARKKQTKSVKRGAAMKGPSMRRLRIKA